MEPPEVLEELEAWVRSIVREEVETLLPTLSFVSKRDLLTYKEVAEQLGCSYDAVRMHVKRGRLEAPHVGRRRFVTRESLERLR
jgi:excisionase family DNA binding protein